MKRQFWGLAVTGVLIGLAGCSADPTDTISGTPAQIVSTYSKMFLFPGDSVLVFAEVRDDQGVALPIIATATSANEGIVGVTEAYQAPLQQARFFVRGDGVGGGKVIVSAEGLTDTILVSVFPDVFEGDVAVVSTANLDTVVVSVGASGLLFVPGETTVSVDGVPTRIVAESDQEIKALVRSTAALTDVALTIENMIFLDGTEFESNIATLDAADPVSVTGENNEPGNDTSGGATPITLGTVFEGLITESDVIDWLTFTLAADQSLDITIEFDGGGGDPDLDVFLRNAALGSAGGCSMATGSQPEECTTSVLTAGTYYLRIEFYDSGSATAPHWYRVTIQ